MYWRLNKLSFERPAFKNLISYEQFNQYYWYREELSQICKSLGLEYRGTKKELNHIIEAYFEGNIIKPVQVNTSYRNNDSITIDTPLLECGFSFNERFREYFSAVTGITPFKFNADMAAAWRKVKKEKDTTFTISDMIQVYYGKSDYSKYDRSVCQWNQFLKDFCQDKEAKSYSDKLKVAAILWKKVRDSKGAKIYSRELLSLYSDEIAQYLITNHE